MLIDAFLTPFFPEKESQFDGSIVVMIDVLRASTTICAALYNGAKEIIPTESLEKAVRIYSSLSKEIRFLGGERNGIKPNGFDAGNSPSEYTQETVKDKTVILTTSNGTITFQKAQQAKVKIIGSFVNMTAVLNYLKNLLSENNNKLSFLCAGTNGRLSYEDTLCAGAFINHIKRNFKDAEMTDSAHAAKNLYNLHSVELNNFLKTREHSVFLNNLGFSEDVNTALLLDKYPVIPIISGNSIKKADSIY